MVHRLRRGMNTRTTNANVVACHISYVPYKHTDKQEHGGESEWRRNDKERAREREAARSGSHGGVYDGVVCRVRRQTARCGVRVARAAHFHHPQARETVKLLSCVGILLAHAHESWSANHVNMLGALPCEWFT